LTFSPTVYSLILVVAIFHDDTTGLSLLAMNCIELPLWAFSLRSNMTKTELAAAAVSPSARVMLSTFIGSF
jgi:hypothetical protein